MVSQLAVLILAIAKAVPAVERIIGQLVELRNARKIESNSADEEAKNKRDIALIAAARGKLHLCSSCPFGGNSGGQHQGFDGTPGIQPSGGSSAELRN